MKILVVDGDQSFSALLSRALRKLGHAPASAGSAAEAVAKARADVFDIVIAALELPDMDGIELAALLRTEHDDLTIAFCSSGTGDLLHQAARVGRVLPRVWTVATLKDLLVALERDRRKLATGTDRPRWVSPASAVRHVAANPLAVSATMRPVAPPSGGPPPPRRAMSPSPPPVMIEELPPADDDSSPDVTSAERPSRTRLALRKIRLSCRSWDQVERLCAQQAAGRTVLTLRGPYKLELHEPLVVALALPDELVLSLRAEVIAIRQGDDGSPVIAIELSGLTDAVTARLEAMAAQALSPGLDIASRPTRPLSRAQSEISFA